MSLLKVEVETKSGPVDFRFNICSPSDSRAESIDPEIPTLLFIHAEYIASEAWQYQFDSSLRRFNLVSFDLRTHGDTVTDIPTGYSRVEAAEETAKLMDVLKLPACHIVGASIGGDIALQMAIDYPTKVKSVMLIAPLPDHEDDNVSSARQEIFEAWTAGNEEMFWHSIAGGRQLVNNIQNPLTRSFRALHLPRARQNWSMGPASIQSFANISVKYFQLNRERLPSEYKTLGLSNIPVLILHCTKDVTVGHSHALELKAELENAGVGVMLVSVEGAPHLGQLTHPKIINESIEKFLEPLCPGGTLPPDPKEITSPWDEILRRGGWRPVKELEEGDIDEEIGGTTWSDNELGLK